MPVRIGLHVSSEPENFGSLDQPRYSLAAARRRAMQYIA